MAERAGLLSALSPIRQHWVPTDQAIEQYLAYEERYGRGHALLACHAAFPLVVTPELVNLIRLNFLADQNIDWLAEADFLLAFCHSMDAGQGLYQIDPKLREIMLVDLQELDDGIQRLYELADFLLAYSERFTEHQRWPDIARVHQWIAWSYLDLQRVVDEMRVVLLTQNSQVIGDVQTAMHQIHVITMMEVMRDAFEIGPPALQRQYNELLENAQIVVHFWFKESNLRDLSSDTNLMASSSTKSTMSNLPYDSSIFVDRKEELAWVSSRVSLLLQKRLEKRTLIFTGGHGIGKTWFLEHLKAHLRVNPDIRLLHFDLSQLNHAAEPSSMLEAILSLCNEELLASKVIAESNFQEITHLLIQEIKQQVLSTCPLVLLIDSVYEASPGLLSLLENHLLGPLAVEPGVLIILAGRGQPFSFTAPELRLRAEVYVLPAFPLEWTDAQLKQQTPQTQMSAAEIQAISLGIPKANRLLAQNANWADAFNQLLDDMLLLLSPDERKGARNCLLALSVPHFFDYSMMPPILAAFYDDSAYLQISRREIRRMVDLLIKPGYVYWSNERSFYMLHEATRHWCLNSLKEGNPNAWLRIRSSLIELLQRWCKESPNNQAFWQTEIAYLKEDR